MSLDKTEDLNTSWRSWVDRAMDAQCAQGKEGTRTWKVIVERTLFNKTGVCRLLARQESAG